jgi:hypothetical protein
MASDWREFMAPTLAETSDGDSGYVVATMAVLTYTDVAIVPV